MGDMYAWERKAAYELSSGAVIALELDPDNDKMLDEGPSSSGGWSS